ncbi:UTP--glucose-1-phosphate uridylyltransferase GalU [Agitococcus lubricus]|uniref:UTP--glucose-1-phosphate uridylyltransferase n=1 Tax=Agitococcus lubricus TaxID=1077255 RepID=A0A2T5J096_9GAMM|nr:UTP--glucose-1-phosphate uridylyltransferase GalU [Agitococcus lubricus]PTQ89764.1 UDP-glucose pyrophosphorylase [Agitococcus lubricus]
MRASIQSVVLPVAGLGTRFLPATKAIPKEMLPVLDKPLIQLAVEEAHKAGIKQVVLVTSASKRAIEDHFDVNFELEATLEQRGKLAMLDAVKTTLPNGMTLAVVRQPKALGLGHAVLCAQPIVGNQPFAVMLPDDFIDDTQGGCLADMVALYNQEQAYSLAVEEVPRDKTDKYGVVSLNEEGRIVAMVEKPKPEVAPSTLAVVGRYVLPGAIFEALTEVKPGAGGEIQLTDGIASLLASEHFRPHRFKGVRYDCGSKLGYLQANVALGLRDTEVGQSFAAWLKTQ